MFSAPRSVWSRARVASARAVSRSSATSPKMRSTAVNGSPAAGDYLVEMYPGATHDEKKEIIHSMLILDDTDALLGLMKQEEDPALKREMLQMLVMMGSEGIDEELFELLESEK